MQYQQPPPSSQMAAISFSDRIRPCQIVGTGSSCPQCPTCLLRLPRPIGQCRWRRRLRASFGTRRSHSPLYSILKEGMSAATCSRFCHVRCPSQALVPRSRPGTQAPPMTPPPLPRYGSGRVVTAASSWMVAPSQVPTVRQETGRTLNCPPRSRTSLTADNAGVAETDALRRSCRCRALKRITNVSAA